MTDLYSAQSTWVGVAQTDDAHHWVVDNQPFPTDTSNLTVRTMDMRNLEGIEDQSIDFAWSISSLEHIGVHEDFVRHFQEVRRVLRPDGMYLLTTEMRVGGPTFEIVGNMCFGLDHMQRILSEAGMQAEPVFDARTADIHANDPQEEFDHWPRVPGMGLTNCQPFYRSFCGIMSTPGVFCLRPAEGTVRPMDVRGYDQTAARAERRRTEIITSRVGHWVPANPMGLFHRGLSPRITHQRDQLSESEIAQAPPGLVGCTKYFLLIGGQTTEVKFALFVSEHQKGTTVSLGFNRWKQGVVEGVEAGQRKVVTLSGSGPAMICESMTFIAEPGYSYSFLVTTPDESLRIEAIEIEYKQG